MTFRLPACFLTLSIVLTIFNTACTQRQRTKRITHRFLKQQDTSVKPTLILDTSKIAIIPFEKNDIYPWDSSYNKTNLSDIELTETYNLLTNFIIDYNNSQNESDNTYVVDIANRTYWMRLTPVINQIGQKEISVNGLCDVTDQDWKSNSIKIIRHGGGSCYFDIKVNLGTKKCYDYKVNDLF